MESPRSLRIPRPPGSAPPSCRIMFTGSRQPSLSGRKSPSGAHGPAEASASAAGRAGATVRSARFRRLPALGGDFRMAQQTGIAVRHLAQLRAVLVGRDAGHPAREVLLQIGLVPAQRQGSHGERDAAAPQLLLKGPSFRNELHRVVLLRASKRQPGSTDTLGHSLMKITILLTKFFRIAEHTLPFGLVAFRRPVNSLQLLSATLIRS